MTATVDKTHSLLESIRDGIVDLHKLTRSQLASRSVLACETWTFPASGIIERSWHVPYASVSISTQSVEPITATSSPAVTANPPSSGPGVAVVTGSAVVNLVGHTLTLYGNPGDSVRIEVFGATQPPAWAPLGGASSSSSDTVTASVIMRPASNPAAGQPAVFTVPAGQTWTVRAAYASFATGVETAARMPILQYLDGTGVFATYPNPAPISVPSNTYTPTWGFALGQYDTSHTSRAAGLVPIKLGPGSKVQISASSLQTDDQFSNVALCVDVTGEEDSANISVQRPANPAAGAASVLTVPSNEVWVVKSVAATLTLGTESVDRMLDLSYLDSTGVFATFPCPGTVNTPGAVVNGVFGAALGQYESTHQTRAAGLDEIQLSAGMQVQINARGQAADDQISNVIVCVEAVSV
jgi:hypothetical protein